MSLINFLKTKTSKTKLKHALEVLKEFKHNESKEEWLFCPFMAWAKLEQLEEYLEFFVNKKKLEKDTLKVLNSIAQESCNKSRNQ